MVKSVIDLSRVGECPSDDALGPQTFNLGRRHAEEEPEDVVGVAAKGGPAWVTRPGVADSRGTTAGWGRGPMSDGTSMMVLRSR